MQQSKVNPSVHKQGQSNDRVRQIVDVTICTSHRPSLRRLSDADSVRSETARIPHTQHGQNVHRIQHDCMRPPSDACITSPCTSGNRCGQVDGCLKLLQGRGTRCKASIMIERKLGLPGGTLGAAARSWAGTEKRGHRHRDIPSISGNWGARSSTWTPDVIIERGVTLRDPCQRVTSRPWKTMR